MAFLLIQRPGHADERFPLPDGQIRVGRMRDNQVVIDDPSISRHHALISPGRDGYTVADTGSRNGIWVNGQRSGDAPVPLRHGDEVEVGGQGVVVKYFADDAQTPDATAFFMPVPELERHRVAAVLPDALYEKGERWMKILRVTPWLRFAGAAIGTLAATLAPLRWRRHRHPRRHPRPRLLDHPLARRLVEAGGPPSPETRSSTPARPWPTACPEPVGHNSTSGCMRPAPLSQ